VVVRGNSRLSRLDLITRFEDSPDSGAEVMGFGFCAEFTTLASGAIAA
jgi:hypothetical protein